MLPKDGGLAVAASARKCDRRDNGSSALRPSYDVTFMRARAASDCSRWLVYVGVVDDIDSVPSLKIRRLLRVLRLDIPCTPYGRFGQATSLSASNDQHTILSKSQAGFCQHVRVRVPLGNGQATDFCMAHQCFESLRCWLFAPLSGIACFASA